MEKICPKCNKDYSSDPHWKSNLKKHLTRKNPCDRSKNEQYIRSPKNKKCILPISKQNLTVYGFCLPSY